MTASEASEDRLAEVALELAVRVREYDPQSNAIWLDHQLPHAGDRYALLFVLAAAVPVDQPWSDLTGWARPEVRALVAERFHAA